MCRQKQILTCGVTDSHWLGTEVHLLLLSVGMFYMVFFPFCYRDLSTIIAGCSEISQPAPRRNLCSDMPAVRENHRAATLTH